MALQSSWSVALPALKLLARMKCSRWLSRISRFVTPKWDSHPCDNCVTLKKSRSQKEVRRKKTWADRETNKKHTQAIQPMVAASVNCLQCGLDCHREHLCSLVVWSGGIPEAMRPILLIGGLSHSSKYQQTMFSTIVSRMIRFPCKYHKQWFQP